MSKISLKPADTGTATFTLEAPATNTNRTITLPDEAGSVLTSAGVPASAMPAGSVIQVKHVVNRADIQVSASNTVVDLGLSISITPTSVNSKFLLLCRVAAEHANSGGSGYGLIWFRNGTEVRNLVDNFESYYTSNSYVVSSFQYFDEPLTTSTITYEAKPITDSTNPIKFSSQGYFDNNLTLMEIAG